ncbi:type III effector [Cellvibrio zantedeschiae]|uniref:Type III effector n=1 Tax=Cellvibrio zantedeschiae TaxID=1237077 RepID=A0ABQ3AZF5_9GAMM|nr:HopJ type III effector protein [Cellvibrio zantedeschiae]GGY70657.1 type III effector [Cellvibrio zantedeschiae]
MQLDDFLTQLKTAPEQISFADTIATVDANYDFTPTAFRNGDLENAAGQNSGSCKLLSLAKLHNLSVEQTLHCFGDYYRVDVLQHPDATDHQNIRNFIRHGWNGVKFEGSALTAKN